MFHVKHRPSNKPRTYTKQKPDFVYKISNTSLISKRAFCGAFPAAA